MQVLVLAVQNSVDFAHLGVATSGTTLFRSVGGALGVALFGAVFLNGLQADLAGVVPPGTAMPSASNPASLAALPESLRAAYVVAVVAALKPVFHVAAAIAAIGFTLTVLLREVPLRGVAPAESVGESFAMPRDATSLEELERIVARLLAQENRWRVYADLAARAGLSLPPAELWMLARLGEREPQSPAPLSAELGIAWRDLEGPLNALCDRGVVEKNAAGALRLTEAGRAMREKLLAARRQGLSDMLTRWEPDKHPDVLALLDRMVATLVRDLPMPRQEAGV
jgi:DNA-binding MarR family transcriptional regulator